MNDKDILSFIRDEFKDIKNDLNLLRSETNKNLFDIRKELSIQKKEYGVLAGKVALIISLITGGYLVTNKTEAYLKNEKVKVKQQIKKEN